MALKRTSYITIVVGPRKTRRRETSLISASTPAGSVWESRLTTGLAVSPTPPPRRYADYVAEDVAIQLTDNLSAPASPR